MEKHKSLFGELVFEVLDEIRCTFWGMDEVRTCRIYLELRRSEVRRIKDAFESSKYMMEVNTDITHHAECNFTMEFAFIFTSEVTEKKILLGILIMTRE